MIRRLAVLAATSLAACSSKVTDGPPARPAPAVAPAGKAAPATAAPAAPEAPRSHTMTVHIRGFQFAPKDLVVEPGDTLIWVNDDAVPHTTTADAGAWSSKEIPRGGSWTMVVRTGGAYHCEAHKVMRGSLNLRAP